MAHVAAEILIKRWEEAVAKVPVGTRWFHYKQPDKPYVVKGVSIREETEEPEVLYHPDYDNFPEEFVWVRPISEWFSEVETEQGVKTDRFQRVR